MSTRTIQIDWSASQSPWTNVVVLGSFGLVLWFPDGICAAPGIVFLVKIWTGEADTVELWTVLEGTWADLFGIGPDVRVLGLGICSSDSQITRNDNERATIDAGHVFVQSIDGPGTQDFDGGRVVTSPELTCNPGAPTAAFTPWDRAGWDLPDFNARMIFSYRFSAEAGTEGDQTTMVARPLSVSVVTNEEEESSMINLRTGQWNLHREGVAELLKIAAQALCAGTALAVTGEIRLWTSDNAPGCDDLVAGYTEALFSGYAPVVIDSGNGGCTDILEIGVNDSGIGQIVIDQQEWTEANPATITETINGAYLVLIDGATEILLATFLFPDPAGMAAPGDILKVGGFALLDCQMAPVA